jgi:hypothetical protein
MVASGSNEERTWDLFCRELVLRRELKLAFVCGGISCAAKVAVEYLPRHSYACRGDLFGRPFSFEALSRNRLDENERDSHVPLFAGSFQHEGGPSGDFQVRERSDGELMTVGFFGAPRSIRAVPEGRSMP